MTSINLCITGLSVHRTSVPIPTLTNLVEIFVCLPEDLPILMQERDEWRDRQIFQV